MGPVVCVPGLPRPASPEQAESGAGPWQEETAGSRGAEWGGRLIAGASRTMASRLLHRLRHALALTGEGPGEPAQGLEAEEFPESSELEEDDTEGLSTRLSGTLSFTSTEDDEEEEEEEENGDPLGSGAALGRRLKNPGEDGSGEDGDRSPQAEGPRGSNLLTRQLQDFWKKSKSNLVPQRLLFEVTSANVINEPPSKSRATGACASPDFPALLRL
ncbi:sorting nexin-21 isoform X3 [Phascolarctos cinereus]|uniref:Sorting nexin-21 isoform X3 n=1 Tax=Phascolarctos cinereus TaxID=38626 RepID=A0A6P5IJG5_PHACI|nr:sorting nexin-21 isoform X3 [Phascolarctos cinereus]